MKHLHFGVLHENLHRLLRLGLWHRGWHPIPRHSAEGRRRPTALRQANRISSFVVGGLQMSYNYQTERPYIFTEDGQVMFLKIRDQANRLIKEAGAASMGQIVNNCTGSSWSMLACVDRLVELGELRELPNPHSHAGQHRMFTILGSMG